MRTLIATLFVILPVSAQAVDCTRIYQPPECFASIERQLAELDAQDARVARQRREAREAREVEENAQSRARYEARRQRADSEWNAHYRDVMNAPIERPTHFNLYDSRTETFSYGTIY